MLSRFFQSSLRSMVPLATLAAALAGGCGSGSGGSGGVGGSGGAGGSGGSSSSGFEPGSPHTPATGCHEGFVACGDVCANLAEDGRHCGACGNPCMFEEGCVGGTCVGGQGCVHTDVSCDGMCTAPYENADHCGSCGNRCSDKQLCADGNCKAAGGDGTSCASPLFWDSEEDESAGFRFTPGTTVPHTFGCSPEKALPTRWFRFIAPKDNTNVRIYGAEGDDYLIELFSGPACDASVFVGCNDQKGSIPGELPVIDISTMEGTPFFVAVGLKGTWSGEPAEIHVDH
jgi:hypothetical protein